MDVNMAISWWTEVCDLEFVSRVFTSYSFNSHHPNQIALPQNLQYDSNIYAGRMLIHLATLIFNLVKVTKLKNTKTLLLTDYQQL